ncbi:MULTISPECIES: hypothetical protein [unclassified Streptomyces]|nr:hypothetical protein [Streptomyces sp. NBC_01439]
MSAELEGLITELEQLTGASRRLLLIEGRPAAAQAARVASA